MKDSTVILIRVTKENKAKLQKQASDEGRTLSGLLRYRLERAYPELKKIR